IPVDQLVEPLFLQRYPEPQNLWIAKSLCIVRTQAASKSLSIAADSFLSPGQSEEMRCFFEQLFLHYKEQRNTGPVVRASNWVSAKFENNTSLPEWFSKLKAKLSDEWD